MTRMGTKAAKSILEERLKLGLTSEEFIIMKILQTKPMTVDQLYDFFGVTKFKEIKISNAVAELEKKKIVTINAEKVCEVKNV